MTIQPPRHKAEHQLTISEQPLIVCWMCGDLREVEGNCPHCKAPKEMPDNWDGLTAKRAMSIDAQKRQDVKTDSIDKKPSKPVSKRPKKCEIYSSIFLRKTTKTAFRALRKVLPYSAQCHSDDELLSKLIEKGRISA
jgi:RNA polymerase subunit RPABC4/transcription elongation factor Spt4